MTTEINNFCHILENFHKKLVFDGQIDHNKANMNSIVNIKYYDSSLYDCEIATLYRNEYSALEIWRNIFNGEFFELKHPIKNNIMTRAVYAITTVDSMNAIFFIDADNKNPWLCINVFGFAYGMFIDGSFFSPEKYIVTPSNSGSRLMRRKMINAALEILPHKQYLKYDNNPFHIHLCWNRPFHHFLDDLTCLYSLDLLNSQQKIAGRGFWLPHNTNVSLRGIPIVPRLNRFFAQKFLEETYRYVNNMTLEHSLIAKIDGFSEANYLTIWLGIPGERRAWLNQLEGIPSILKNIAKYFSKIKVYVDGMTAYDGERIEVADNLKAFESIKAEVDKLNLDIDMESLSGYDYRTKICYCSTCDIAISDTGTTALVPFAVCKKPGVAFSQDAGATYREALNYQKDIKSLYAIEEKFLMTVNIRNFLSKDFHIPWQHLYNLAAQSLDEIKGIKMHRLDVPPVELVVKQYDLEQELGIKIPIESIALFDEVKQELNKISKEQESNKELLESIALFDEVKQELNKISKEQKSNKELLTQIISSSMILQNYVNKKNLQDQSIINQNQNLIAELLYCKEQNSILEQKLAPKAKSRIHNQLSYKLGQAMIANSKSIWG
ncbi:MAG: hypothetical protein IJ965_03265, partial [Campylobacter sp.]|nr:hypothetical protein [Campylobacter sp.]